MVMKHPYVASSGVIVRVLEHLRGSFPGSLDADVLKKLGLAPKNESYVLNVVRFLGLIDDKAARTTIAQKAFTIHDNSAFQQAFTDIVKNSYKNLFELHSDKAWSLDRDKLITFFRQSDHSTALVGARQAVTFAALAAYAGQTTFTDRGTTSGVARAQAAPRSMTAKKDKRRAAPEVRHAVQNDKAQAAGGQPNAAVNGAFGLTVRIEINLPGGGDQKTYDHIFRSIRENLLNG